MQKIRNFFLICILFVAVKCQVSVNTTRGTVIGYHVDFGNDTTKDWYGQADVFYGIPYAIGPSGNLRFKYARPLLQFDTNPYNATYYRPACIQSGKNASDVSEDCLYVNIWTPNAAATAKYAVMVWIHGGGLHGGDGRLGDAGVTRSLISTGIVVAGIQYRLGWLGFFTTLTDDFPPNIGMVDQVTALKFIKQEISYFGGNPNQITLFGQSAGGYSCCAHTYSPLSQNLFQQSIMESGSIATCLEGFHGLSTRRPQFANLTCNFTQQQWDSGNFAPLKDCLMNIDPLVGSHHDDRVYVGNSNCYDTVQDNYFFPGDSQDLSKKRPNIPVMVGTCKDEYAPWVMNQVKQNVSIFTRQYVEENLIKQYTPWFGNQTNTLIQLFESSYLPPGAADDDNMAWLQFFVDVDTASYFTWGALREAEYYVANKNPNVYLYEFAWSSKIDDFGNPLPNWHPVCHTCELGFLFNFNQNWNKTDQELALLVQSVWSNFAKTGNPTPDNSWHPTTSTNNTALEYFEFNNVSSAKQGYRTKDEIVWDQDLQSLLGQYPLKLPDNYALCQRGHQSKITPTTCYEALSAPLSWSVAQNACVNNSYGSLVSINSAFENSDFINYAKSTYPSCAQFFIGLFRTPFVSNKFTFANYAPSTYTNWASGYPINDPLANCVAVNANDGTWKNVDCNTALCYVCSNY